MEAIVRTRTRVVGPRPAEAGGVGDDTRQLRDRGGDDQGRECPARSFLLCDSERQLLSAIPQPPQGEGYSRVPRRDGASRSSNSFRSSSLTSCFFRALLRSGASAARSLEVSGKEAGGVRSLDFDWPKSR